MHNPSPTAPRPGPCGMVFLALVAVAPPAGPPLHQRIDQEIAAASKSFQPAPPASDAEFLRRIYLDLTGTIPTAAEARAFLDDTAADKRARLIDQLLAGPRYPRRMQTIFDVLLVERRPDKHVPRAQWQDYL